MEIIRSSHDLMDRIEKLSKDNSVCQVFIPGKEQLTIVLQGNELGSIAAEVNADPELRLMIDDSREADGGRRPTIESHIQSVVYGGARGIQGAVALCHSRISGVLRIRGQ